MKKFDFSLFAVLFILALLASCLISFKLFPRKSSPEQPTLLTITIGDKKIFIETADTPEKKSKGLSNRSSLPENQGMLFVYDAPQKPAFWMKDTLIPLDFVWINQDRVVQLTAEVEPEEYQPPKTLSPEVDVTAVLEVNAGTIEKLGIEVGNQVEF